MDPTLHHLYCMYWAALLPVNGTFLIYDSRPVLPYPSAEWVLQRQAQIWSQVRPPRIPCHSHWDGRGHRWSDGQQGRPSSAFILHVYVSTQDWCICMICMWKYWSTFTFFFSFPISPPHLFFQMVHFITSHADKIESIHLSDQFSGPKVMQEYVHVAFCGGHIWYDWYCYTWYGMNNSGINIIGLHDVIKYMIWLKL